MKADHWLSSRGCRSPFLNQFLSRALWIYTAAGCQTKALEEGALPLLGGGRGDQKRLEPLYRYLHG